MMKELVGVIAVVIIIAVVKYFRSRNSRIPASDIGSGLLEKLKKTVPDPRAIWITGVSLLVLNLLLWGLTRKIPDIWNWYWGESWFGSMFFWVFNLGWLFVAILSTLKGEDKKILPVAANIRKAVFAIMVLGFLSNFSYEKTVSLGVQNYRKITGPAILEIIADCESGNETPGSGRHLEDDGTTVITSKNKDGSLDIGKYQINSVHLAKAEELGFDLYTLEGNTAYARWLFERESTMPWVASSDCWLPKIESAGIIFFSTVVSAPTEDWSERVGVPAGTIIDWVEMEGSIRIRSDKGEVAKQNLAEGKKGVLHQKCLFVQFRSMGKKPVDVIVMISPKRI